MAKELLKSFVMRPKDKKPALMGAYYNLSSHRSMARNLCFPGALVDVCNEKGEVVVRWELTGYGQLIQIWPVPLDSELGELWLKEV